MCITSGKADLESTLIYTGIAQKGGKDVHVTLYQNKARNLAEGGNAMFLAVPAKNLGPENFLDLSSCPKVLSDMKAASTPQARGLLSLDFSEARSVQVFDSGIYTCVVAGPDAGIDDITLAIGQQVEERKRPRLSAGFINGIRDAYRSSEGQAPYLLIGCFSNRDADEGLIGYWYEPTNPSELFFPALDDHDGAVPRLGPVSRDHVIMAGSVSKRRGCQVNYSDKGIPPSVSDLLPTHVVSEEIRGRMLNGDFVIAADGLDNVYDPVVKLLTPPNLR